MLDKTEILKALNEYAEEGVQSSAAATLIAANMLVMELEEIRDLLESICEMLGDRE